MVEFQHYTEPIIKSRDQRSIIGPTAVNKIKTAGPFCLSWTDLLFVLFKKKKKETNDKNLNLFSEAGNPRHV